MNPQELPLAKVLVIHGPNLNMLGTREPEIYGRRTLNEINSALLELGHRLGMTVETFQSNHEGAIVDRLQQAAGSGCEGLVINAAAYTHTSVAIRDALTLLTVPIIEVHLSNVHKRESFRHHSFMAGVVTGQVIGLGPVGYELALRGLGELIRPTVRHV